MFIENTKNTSMKYVEYMVYVMVAIFPFFIFKNFLYQGSSSRFLLLSLVSSVCAIIVGIIFLKNRSAVSIPKSPILYVFACYFVYLFVSAFLGVDFTTSFWSHSERTSGLFYVTHLVPFLFCVVYILTQKESREKFLKVFLVSSAFYSFLALIGHQGFKLLFTKNPFDGFLFGNSSFAGMYLLSAFLLSLYFVFRKKISEIKWYEYLLPFIIAFNPYFINIKMFTGGATGISDVFGIAKASSASLMLSVVLLCIAWIISKIKSIKVRNITAITFASVSLVLLALVMNSLLSDSGFVRKEYEKQSTLARPVVWDISKDAINERPLFGWGVDNFPEAFQKHFDTKLLEERFGNEPWFDRAHNVVLDQTVDTGYLGVSIYFLLYGVLLACLIYSILKSKNREDGLLGTILSIYFFLHLLELQTAFDTTISALAFVIMVAFSVVLYDKVRNENGVHSKITLNKFHKYSIGTILIGYFGWALFFGTIPFWHVQNVNAEIRRVGSAEKRIPMYQELFKVKIDKLGMLWRISTDFQRGISENPNVLEDAEKSKALLSELDVFTKEYEKYIELHPESFRAYLNLADMYIYHMLFGVNMLNEADVVLDKAIKISPDHPQSYWMKSVVSLYRKDFKNAEMYVEMAKKINPEVVETKRLELYIKESIKTFPEIDLYFFNQI